MSFNWADGALSLEGKAVNAFWILVLTKLKTGGEECSLRQLAIQILLLNLHRVRNGLRLYRHLLCLYLFLCLYLCLFLYHHGLYAICHEFS